MTEFYNNHYIRTDASGNIVEGWSDGPHRDRIPTEDDILINDRGGYQFRLVIERFLVDGPEYILTEENPALYGDNFVPLYRLAEEQVQTAEGAVIRYAVRRGEDELEAERAEMASALEQAEAERVANATETALLEIAAEHEERLCLLEMGITDEL